MLREEGREDFTIKSGSFTFIFNLSHEEIRVFKTEEMDFLGTNSMLDIGKTGIWWKASRNNFFSPESDNFEKWQKNMEELIEDSTDMKIDMRYKLDDKAVRAVVKVNKTIEKIKEKINNIKEI